MRELVVQAERISHLLKSRKETIVIAESSTGGLISAALLSIPGASAYFLGGAVVYTKTARSEFFDITDETMNGMRASTQPYALLLANTARQRFGASWALGESGATGPAGNRYGDASGHCCIAVTGLTERAMTLETGVDDRYANMFSFAAAALKLLETALNEAG